MQIRTKFQLLVLLLAVGVTLPSTLSAQRVGTQAQYQGCNSCALVGAGGPDQQFYCYTSTWGEIGYEMCQANEWHCLLSGHTCLGTVVQHSGDVAPDGVLLATPPGLSSGYRCPSVAVVEAGAVAVTGVVPSSRGLPKAIVL
jgi:hypothetical protein